MWFALAMLLSTGSSASDTLTAVQDIAIAKNPGITAREGRIRELAARAEVAGAWSDPMVSVEYSNAPLSSLSLATHPMSGVQFKASQTLRPFAWSASKREIGLTGVAIAELELAESEIALRAAVGRTWWMLTRTRLLREVTASHLALTEEIIASARVRYETGDVGQHAVLRLELLRDRLSDELADFQEQDRALDIALYAVLGEAGRPFETPDNLTALTAPPDGAFGAWASTAVDRRPLFGINEARRDRANAVARHARLDARPNPSIWAGYRVRFPVTAGDPGEDFISAGVGVPIPTGSSRVSRGEQKATEESLESLGRENDLAAMSVVAETEIVHSRWIRAYTKAMTYADTLLPGARAMLETTRSDFATGRADFASLYEAEVALLELERSLIVATVETHLQAVEAVALVGRPLEDSP